MRGLDCGRLVGNPLTLQAEVPSEGGSQNSFLFARHPGAIRKRGATLRVLTLRVLFIAENNLNSWESWEIDCS